MNKHIIIFFAFFIWTISVLPLQVSAQSAPLNRLNDATLDGGKEILPTFTFGHPECVSASPGVVNICSSILYVNDFMKYIMGGIAAIFLFVSATRLITASGKVDEEIEKERENFKFTVIGLLVIILASALVNEIVSSEGNIDFLESVSQAQSTAEEASRHLRGVYNFIELFIGAIAIITFMIAGFRMIAGGGNEDVIKTQKRHIMWASIGLLVIGISETVVKDVVFGEVDDPGKKLGLSQGFQVIAGITNFFASLISFFSILGIVYAGFLYITARGEEDQVSKAKKILLGVIIGIIIAAAAYALTNTFIGLKSS